MRPLPEWQGEYGYFPLLTAREQLNDLVHKYAQINSCPYQQAWKALDAAWAERHGKPLSLLRALEQRKTGKKITLPGYIELAGLMDAALDVAHALIDNVIITWMSEHRECGRCNQTATAGCLPDDPDRQALLPLP